MKYTQSIQLKNGKEVLIRNCDESDGSAVLEVFNKTHEETDYMLTYTEENSFTPEQEAQYLHEKSISPNEIELIAIVDGKCWNCRY